MWVESDLLRHKGKYTPMKERKKVTEQRGEKEQPVPSAPPGNRAAGIVDCVIKKSCDCIDIKKKKGKRKKKSIGRHLSSVIMFETIINTRNNNL